MTHCNVGQLRIRDQPEVIQRRNNFKFAIRNRVVLRFCGWRVSLDKSLNIFKSRIFESEKMAVGKIKHQLESHFIIFGDQLTMHWWIRISKYPSGPQELETRENNSFLEEYRWKKQGPPTISAKTLTPAPSGINFRIKVSAVSFPIDFEVWKLESAQLCEFRNDTRLKIFSTFKAHWNPQKGR